jgi:hypothetical protein
VPDGKHPRKVGYPKKSSLNLSSTDAVLPAPDS